MKILFAAQYYWPEVGGVQKVLHELARRLVRRGHEVTVATSTSTRRTGKIHDGVRIEEFMVSGNIVQGMQGDVEGYQRFLSSCDCDVFLVKAAQQWTFDACLPVLPKMRARKLHIPCGYSGLDNPRYHDYFQRMPEWLRLFDRLLYYSSDYFDINFARAHGLQNLTVLCNGACEEEFASLDTDFRQQHGVAPEELLLLTVGSPPDSKGHGDCLEAFCRAKLPVPATLVMIGPYAGMNFDLGLWQRLRHRFKKNRFRLQMCRGLRQILRAPDKRLLLPELDRARTLAAFKAADLFLFASHVEYSPLVLFEAAAAATPFLSVDAGNAAEIAVWTGCGIISPAASRKGPWVRPDCADLARRLEALAADRDGLRALSEVGRHNWRKNYTWDTITDRYEEYFKC